MDNDEIPTCPMCGETLYTGRTASIQHPEFGRDTWCIWCAREYERGRALGEAILAGEALSPAARLGVDARAVVS